MYYGKRNICSVREFRYSDLDSIKEIIQDLHPEWFTEEALENIPRDIQLAKCYVAERDETVIGFVSVYSHDGNPMISWLGVDKKLQGAGIGRVLLTKVENELKNLNYKDLRVQTVGECTPRYEPYAETLKFYISMGFEVVKKGRLRNNMGYKWRYSTLRKRLT
jgi:ribosomal protein S18 acetylase RimI-like enzyme